MLELLFLKLFAQLACVTWILIICDLWPAVTLGAGNLLWVSGDNFRSSWVWVFVVHITKLHGAIYSLVLDPSIKLGPGKTKQTSITIILIDWYPSKWVFNYPAWTIKSLFKIILPQLVRKVQNNQRDFVKHRPSFPVSTIIFGLPRLFHLLYLFNPVIYPIW